MSTPSKNKWLASIFLAGILLALTLAGGKWGTIYTANAEVNSAPQIFQLTPARIPAGVMAGFRINISGDNFGTSDIMRVRVKNATVDVLIKPYTILFLPTGDFLSVEISGSLRMTPTIYQITLVKSTGNSIPTIPITPYDEESNAVPFTIFEVNQTYIPIINNNH